MLSSTQTLIISCGRPAPRAPGGPPTGPAGRWSLCQAQEPASPGVLPPPISPSLSQRNDVWTGLREGRPSSSCLGVGSSAFSGSFSEGPHMNVTLRSHLQVQQTHESPHQPPAPRQQEHPPPQAGNSPFSRPLPLWLNPREAGRLLGHPGDCNCRHAEGERHRPRGCSVSDRPLRHWSCSTWRGRAGSEQGQGPTGIPRWVPTAQGGQVSETVLQGKTGPPAQEVTSLQKITCVQRSPGGGHPGRALSEETVATKK